jgi:site-specific DNA recombinase
MDSAIQSYQNELESMSGAITDINLRLERLYDAMETGKINLDELAPRIRELQGRQEQLQSRRVEIESQLSDRRVELADLETIYSNADDLHNLLMEGTLIEKRAFIFCLTGYSGQFNQNRRNYRLILLF